MAGRYGNLDYPTLTKRSFLLGVALFVIGIGGDYLIEALALQVPGWETALLLEAGAAGIVIALFAPIVFGVVLPLTE